MLNVFSHSVARRTIPGLLVLLPFVVAQPPAAAQSGGQKNAKRNEPAELPSDQKLLSLHLDFVKKAERLAQEYERSKDWGKAKTVYKEILKLAPQYRNAQARLDAIEQMEASANVKVLRVKADEGWQDTGVIVLEGKPISIRAAGTWVFQFKASLGPDGITIPKELKDFNLGCLVGVIDTGSKDEFEPFPVGAAKSFSAERSGRLYLRMYDVEPDDNEGVLQVEIRGTFETDRDR